MVDNSCHCSRPWAGTLLAVCLIFSIVISPIQAFSIPDDILEINEKHFETQPDDDISQAVDMASGVVTRLPGRAGMAQTDKRTSTWNVELDYSDVLVVYNENSALSTRIAVYFQNARNIPQINMCNITTATTETVDRNEFNNIRSQIEGHLENNNLTETINYIVTTKEVPLRVSGAGWDRACLDSELTLILGGNQSNIGQAGRFVNPYFQKDKPHKRDNYEMYLVTRLTAYNWQEIKGMIDNATISLGNRGLYVLDADASKGWSPGGYGDGNIWLRTADQILTAKGEPTFYDATNTFITGKSNVMGYASWGSNDGHDTTNFVKNNGFETTTGALPDQWYPIYDQGITDNITINTTDSYAGSKSLMINRTSISSNFTGIAQNITITPEVRYYLRGLVNITTITSSGGGGAHIQIQALDSSDNILKVQNTNVRSSVISSWRWLSQLVYEPVAGAVKVRIIAMLNRSFGIVNFDRITFNDILPHNKWIPGSIAETFVSTGGRSFTYGTTYGQSLIADLIRDGVTGIKGYVYEPFLDAIAHPDILFDRYTEGYNLAESYYMASNFLGWMDVVVGDPKLAAYADTLPDMNVSMEGLSYSTNQPNQGKSFDIEITVSNIGNRTVSNVNLDVYLIKDDQQIFIDDPFIPSLDKVGGSFKITIGYVPEFAGNAYIRAVIDKNDYFKEMDESNNIIQKPIYINHRPQIFNLTCLNDTIYRGESFVLSANAEDLETSEQDLIPHLEWFLDSTMTWSAYDDSQIQYSYDLSNNNWMILVNSNMSMEAEKYTFRITFTDENELASNYYLILRALEVFNNPPEMIEINLNSTVIHRSESVRISCVVADPEDPVADLAVEIQYRFRPADITSEFGWLDVGQATFDVQNNYWWGVVGFELNSKIGPYQIRGRVKDDDNDESAWGYAQPELELLNNKPFINEFKVQKSRLYRSEPVELIVSGYDLEDYQKMEFLTCEIEHGLKPTLETEPMSWSSSYLSGIGFDDAKYVWGTYFIPPKDAVLGEHIFRARIMDRDNNWSAWFTSTQIAEVLNNGPVADQGNTPEIIIEDDTVTFDGMVSRDFENEFEELEYYWEIKINTTPVINSQNRSFSYTFTHAGLYAISLRVTDLDGDLAWDNKTITVNNVKPKAALQVNRTNAFTKQSILFTAENSSDTISDMGVLNYTWYFDDGSIGYGMIQNHSFERPGKYEVRITVTDDNGDSHSLIKTVTIKPSTEPVPEKDDNGSDTDDPYQASYIAGALGIIMIVVILLIILLLLIRKKRKKHPEQLHPLPYQLRPGAPVQQTTTYRSGAEVPVPNITARTPLPGQASGPGSMQDKITIQKPGLLPGQQTTGTMQGLGLRLPVSVQTQQQKGGALGPTRSANLPQLPAPKTTIQSQEQAKEHKVETKIKIPMGKIENAVQALVEEDDVRGEDK